MGAAGGKAILEKYGRQYFRDLGRRGFDALVAKHFAGSKDEAINWLQSHSTESHLDRLLREKQDRQIADGAKIVCEELPISLWPDDDISFEEPWAERVSKGKGRSK
jgi:hypothetical protein